MTSKLTPDVTPIHELNVCAKHPNREASLRCIRCDRLMCTDCIVRTSVGYVCKECSRRAEDRFFAAANQDYIIQAAACFVVMAVFCGILTQVGFISTFLSLLLGPVAGGFAGEAAMRLTGRRRGRYTDRIGTAAAGIGGLAGRAVVLITFYQQGYGYDLAQPFLQMFITDTLLDIWFLLFLGTALAGAYARLRGQI